MSAPGSQNPEMGKNKNNKNKGRAEKKGDGSEELGPDERTQQQNPDERTSPQKTGGTVIGFPEFDISHDDPLVLKKKGPDGAEVTFNMFETVYSGDFGSAKLEKLLNYMEFSGKLDFTAFIEGIIYQGFDREFYIRFALSKVTVSQFSRFAILGAVRGSNFKKIVDSCISMPQDLTNLVNTGIVIKTAKKRNDLTILRFTASIPHWVAFWLFKVNMEKKIQTEQCPGWLQFPGAASLPMGKKQRMEHISFCKAFSALLPGGSFNGNIYYTAFMNQIPVKDLPSMIKDGLGVAEEDRISGTITEAEVQELVSMQMVKAK